VRARQRELLDEIERDLLDDTVSTSSVLRKFLILGGKTDSVDLREWARAELRGYEEGVDLPPYRMIWARMEIRGQNGPHLFTHEIGPSDLPEEVREHGGFTNNMAMRQSLDELEKLVQTVDSHIRFARGGGTEIVQMMNRDLRKDDPFAAIYSLAWVLPKSSIEGLIAQVRTAATEIVAELLAELPDDETASPSKAQVDGAVQYIFTGNRGPIHVATSSAASGSTSIATADATALPAHPEPRKTFWQRFRDRGLVVGVAQIVGAVAGCAGVYAALAAGLNWWPF
jgi:hypothetical protein